MNCERPPQAPSTFLCAPPPAARTQCAAGPRINPTNARCGPASTKGKGTRRARRCAAWMMSYGAASPCRLLASMFIVPPGRINTAPSHRVSAQTAALIVPSPANRTTVSTRSAPSDAGVGRGSSGKCVRPAKANPRSANTASTASHLAAEVEPEWGLVMNHSRSTSLRTRGITIGRHPISTRSPGPLIYRPLWKPLSSLQSRRSNP